MWTERIVSSIRPAGTPEPEAGAGALWARAAEAGASRASAAPAARMVMLRCDIGRVLPFLDVSGGRPTDGGRPSLPAPPHQGGAARHPVRQRTVTGPADRRLGCQ